MSGISKLEGQKFSRLLVIGFTGIITIGKQRKSTWKCKCDCGDETIVLGCNLIRGNSKSCGCLNKEKILTSQLKHGMCKERIYGIWTGMRTRCLNKKSYPYKRYGGKGVKIEWDNFESFIYDMYDSYLEHINIYGIIETTIDRIDGKGNYCKDNCRWATRTEQSQNREYVKNFYS